MFARPRLIALLGLAAWLGIVLTIALPRALARHYHVDEVQVAYESALLSIHDQPDDATITTPSLLLLGLAMKQASSATTMFAIARCAFFALLVAKLLVMALAQPYFNGIPKRLLTVAAATVFFPLWLNGFEVRMDVIVSLGAVILYGLTQRAGAGALAPRGYMIAGVCAATMQANSIKALLYWAPFSLLLLVIGAMKTVGMRSRLRLLVAYAAGIVLGLAVNLALVVALGGGEVYFHGIGGAGTLLDSSQRFWPTTELVRLAVMSPLFFTLAAAQVLIVIIAVSKKQIELRSLVTCLFLAWSLLTLYLNPVPFGYNFVHLLPFVFFAGLDQLSWALERYSSAQRPLVAAVATVSIALFARGWLTDPFFVRTNEGQNSYIRAAEALTSTRETVLDGAGLVLTRKPPSPDWLVHSLRMGRYRDGKLTQFATMMIEHPSPVLIDNYRWSWLSPEDLLTRQSLYVRVAPRLWVLGQTLRGTDGDVEIHLGGNYQVVVAPNIDLVLDGTPIVSTKTIALAAGSHHFHKANGGAGIRWLGPRPDKANAALGQVLSLGKGELMFTNEAKDVPR